MNQNAYFLRVLLARYGARLTKLSKLCSRKGLYEFLSRQYSAISAGAMVQTVGAGGEVNKLLAEYAATTGFRVTSIDIDPSRGPDVLGDVCELPLTPMTFDVIVLSEVLEHVRSPADGLRNLRDALKEGGTLILTTPFILPMHDRPHDYFRFTAHGLELLLRDFRNVQIAARDSYYEAIDVLWVRLLQTQQESSRVLALFVVPIVFSIKRPLTVVLSRFCATDGMTTGYVATAMK